MIASRYSVVQSASVAGFAPGRAASTSRPRRGSRSRPRASASRIGTRCVAGDRAVDQQRLGRAADAGAPHLGVDGDRRPPCRASPSGRCRGGRCLRDARRPARAPRSARGRRGSCRRAARSRRDCRRGRAASRRPRRGRWSARAGSHPRGRPAAFRPSTRQAWIAADELQRIRAAAQDHRIAGLEAERAGVGRDVRAGFRRSRR